MQQFDIDNHHQNYQLELQYARARQRQRRRRIILIVFAFMSVFYVFIQPNQYADKSNQIPYSQNNGTDGAINITETNQTLAQIQQHFQILEKLLISQFQGKWTDSQNLSNNLAEATFFKTSYQNRFQIQLQLKLIEGQFLEDYYNQFSFYLNSSQLVYPFEDKKLVFENVRGSYRRSSVFEKDQQIIEIYANLTMNLDYFDSESETIDDITLDLNAHYKLYSDTFSFSSSLGVINIDNKAIIYSTIVSVLSVIQFISCLRLMRDLINQNRIATQFSLFIFVFLMIFDGYLGIVHFFLAIKSEYFLTPAFLELVLFFFLELKLAKHIWQERFINLEDNLNLRRELYRFHLKFYMLAIILVLLLYYFVYYNVFLIAMNLYLLPQIIHVAYQGQYVEFDKIFVFGLLSTRLFIPIYFRGCPYNILHAQVSYLSVTIILLLFVAQVVLYYYQCKIGPRFFIPKCLRPKTHEYFVEQPIEGDCAICITQLTDIPSESQSENKFIAQIISQNSHKLMETPCGHHFHSICLTKWMNVKLNCPTCRSVLPPLI
ncbi:unnamed protein product (macronuclear) [Paramecium tetraurelia]|uniref:RING-type E3 ubiquitin transferase n=1 Tax=Paramecium tetraurelia TaxID=5888 RepID=A0BML0_PARTE|nr:uncharacterized protein GSPATT00030413001 [Paramecium tetraurelia]CAK59777.1 unnamed protein product [Paramecium tetraurelia]|eukprot:XP_001427175.1 hypothetical protein (macronuclear) [Paramecium tetraurelia strain d4-2]